MTFFFPIYFLALGLAFGSFGNTLLIRLPHGKGIGGHSQCPKCKKTLQASELIPILSYLIQGGRCTSCTAKISLHYPLVELLSSLMFLFALKNVDPPFPHALFLGIALWLLLLIAIYDAKTQKIPDALNIPFLIIALLLQAVSGTFDLSGPLLGGGFFGILYVMSEGRWVGSGDILLAMGIGVLLGGWRDMIICLFVTYIVAALVALVLLSQGKKKRKDVIAFAPFLVLGAYATYFFGEKILVYFFI